MLHNITEWRNQIHQGDAAETLAEMPADSVDCVMTSPPYFGLRDYGEDGQIGLEESLGEYIDRLVSVFDELQRVLKPTGSFWLNLGDSFGSSKCKMMVPHRVAMALVDSGWILRSDAVWCLAATTKVYARTQKREGPMMIKDIARLDPETVELWNGEQWTRVVDFYPNPEPQDTLTITLRSGEEINCTGDHLWPTEAGLKQARDLSIGDELHETTLPEPREVASPEGLHDELVGWFVGVYLAEGSRGKDGDVIQIASHTDESDRFDRLCAVADAYHGTCKMHEMAGNAATINLYGDVLTGIIDHYIHGEDAKTKGLTPRAWMRSDDFLDAVLRGYLHGDGHYDGPNNRWRLGFTRNNRLASDLRTVCARLGYQCRLQKGWSDGFGIYRGEIRFDPNDHFNSKSDAEIIDIDSSQCQSFYDIEVANDPHTFALASGVISHNCKPNPMPDPTKDRLNETKEFVFHFVQQGEYHFDLGAIREAHSEVVQRRYEQASDQDRDLATGSQGSAPDRNDSDREGCFDNNASVHPDGKNPGDILDVTVMPYPDAHFAVYPKELCEKPIKAACPEDGIVLDPFAGAGTTCLAAKELGRDFVGIDLNPEYVAMAQARVGVDVDQPELLDDDHTPLTAFTDGGKSE